MADTLTASESRIVNAVLAGLRKQGIMPQRFADLMSTSEVAKVKGCKPVTVQRNWKEWGLQMMGRGLNREMRFTGISVQRHIERVNA